MASALDKYPNEPISININGAIIDVEFDHREVDTVIRLGGEILGQIFSIFDRFDVVVYGDMANTSMRKVSGFSTPYHCVEYCLRAKGYWQ